MQVEAAEELEYLEAKKYRPELTKEQFRTEKGQAIMMMKQNESMNNQTTSGSSINTSISTTTKKTDSVSTHECSLCHGKKRIVKDTFPPMFGTADYKVKCNECGEYFLRSTGHTHIPCPQCHGKGYW